MKDFFWGGCGTGLLEHRIKDGVNCEYVSAWPMNVIMIIIDAPPPCLTPAIRRSSSVKVSLFERWPLFASFAKTSAESPRTLSASENRTW